MQLQTEAGMKSRPNQDYLLRTRIRWVIQKSGYAALFQIRVAVRDREVYLEGQVPTFFLKQIAQTLILPIEGVKTLKNELSVDARCN